MKLIAVFFFFMLMPMVFADLPVIVDDLDWVEVTSLEVESREYYNSTSVVYLDIMEKEVAWRCTGFRISDNFIMTNNHCYEPDGNQKVVHAYFDYIKGKEFHRIKEYNCSTFVMTNKILDYTILKCDDLPKHSNYPLGLSKSCEASPDIYVISQNCDYRFNRGCRPYKKLSPGKINTTYYNSITHSADTLGGSSGAPVIDRSTHKVVGLHFAGTKDAETGRGLYNIAKRMCRILEDISFRNKTVYSQLNIQ